MLVSAITLKPLVWLGCAARVREQTYLFLLEPAEKVNSNCILPVICFIIFQHFAVIFTQQDFFFTAVRQKGEKN